MTLPEAIRSRAAFTDGDLAWRVDDFPSVLSAAATLGLRCSGGQFQFRQAGGPVCDLYWLSVDSLPRDVDEGWPDYVTRSATQVESQFARILRDTDWRHEASRWVGSVYAEQITAGADPRSMLVFAADFEVNGGAA